MDPIEPEISRTKRPPAGYVNFERLRRVAVRREQRGYFTAAQAQNAGISAPMLARMNARGLVIRERPGIYRFRVTTAQTWQDALAGQLLETGGVACGVTAAALFGLAKSKNRRGTFDIMMPRGSHFAKNPRHTTRDLKPNEIVTVDGLPTLHPVRAIIDAAHRMTRKAATEMIEAAVVRRLVRPDELEQRAKELRNSKRPGTYVVLEILRELHPELQRSRNEWEALLVRRMREFGLPEPSLEFVVKIHDRRYLLDAAWPGALVALEFDGRDPHMRRAVFDNDIMRRNDFVDAGWQRFSIAARELEAGDARTLQLVARAIRRVAA